MGLDDLLAIANLAKVESPINIPKDKTVENVNTSTESYTLPTINGNSSVAEILDYMMLFLCHNLNKDDVTFKGGYMLNKLLPEESRLTHDIDFSIVSEEYYDTIKEVLSRLGDSMIECGVITSYDVKDTIEEKISGGVKYHRPDKEKDIGVDVGLHSLSYGVTQWDIMSDTVNGFEVERMLADKMSAIFSRKRFRRSKDLYDMYILTYNFDVDLNKLNTYINNREPLNPELAPFSEAIVARYSHAYGMLDVGRGIVKPSFETCLNVVRTIYVNIGSGKMWDHRLRKVI